MIDQDLISHDKFCSKRTNNSRFAAPRVAEARRGLGCILVYYRQGVRGSSGMMHSKILVTENIINEEQGKR